MRIIQLTPFPSSPDEEEKRRNYAKEKRYLIFQNRAINKYVKYSACF